MSVDQGGVEIPISSITQTGSQLTLYITLDQRQLRGRAEGRPVRRHMDAGAGQLAVGVQATGEIKRVDLLHAPATIQCRHPGALEDVMRYLCMVFNEEKMLDAMPRAEFKAFVDEHLAYDDVLREAGTIWYPTRSSLCRRRRPFGSATARCRSPTGRLPRRKSSSAASI